MKIRYELNYYKILDLEKEYSIFNDTDNRKYLTDIDKSVMKKNYRTLSKIHHPDKGGDKAYFEVLAEAYKVLTDDDLRSNYDSKSKFGANPDINDLLHDFEFSSGSAQNEEYSKRVKKFKKEMTDILLVIDAFQDKISYTRNVQCNHCDGSGFDLMSNMMLDCDVCEGSGELNSETCYACKGRGEVSFEKCLYCNGDTYIEKTETLELEHSDFENGLLKVEFKGNYSKREIGKVGNLYIKIKSEYTEKEKEQ
jgi:DnaJ-class molecular chaperone